MSKSIEYFLKPGIAELGHFLNDFLLDHLSVVNFLSKSKQLKNKPDKEYGTNAQFWNAVLTEEQKGLQQLKLSKFQILDWFPRTPGLYHTGLGKRSRGLAEKFSIIEKGIKIYNPLGKFHMIDGGIGSVRFKPISIEGQEYWLGTATSDNNCSSGIPLAIPNQLMSKIDPFSNYQITGILRYLPKFMENHFSHMSRIPQLFIIVDEIKELGKNAQLAIISPFIFFQNKDSSKSFVSYANCYTNSIKDIDSASQWLFDYSIRFGNGKIMSNFDEQRPNFKDAPFSLQNVMRNEIKLTDLEKLNIYQPNIICDKIGQIISKYTKMTNINKVKVGDGNVFKGDFIVANKIKDSFNRIETYDTNNELKKEIDLLAQSIYTLIEKLGQEDAEQIANDIETLSKEITTKKPRKDWLNLSLSAIKNTAKVAGSIGAAVLQNIDKIQLIIDKLF